MAVNLPLPVAANLKPVPGIELGHAEAGMRKANRKDVLVMRLAPALPWPACLRTNRFCAAPVQICQGASGCRQIPAMPIRRAGGQHRQRQCRHRRTGPGAWRMRPAPRWPASWAASQQVLPFSTGVILEPLPVDRITAGLPQAIANLKADNWYNAAEAIMTTDTQPKAASRTARSAARPSR
jgi:glutamate N-acetyltransferase/amino-acid N-acetyltransferase